MASRTRIGVLTSGGDAPGMNATLRAIVRVAHFHNSDVVGFRRGYRGLINNNAIPLGPRDVSNIIQRGGTILKSARCPEFETEAGIARGAETAAKQRLDALLIIGGDGTMRGGHALSAVTPTRVVGLPGTIDNDLSGTDYTIGFFTALDTAVDAIDKIRDTADAFERLFIVEVMGRLAGFIALGVGVAGGAEQILVPENPPDIDQIAKRIEEARAGGKSSYIIVLAEGAWPGGAPALRTELENRCDTPCRACVLGHTQRGGSPTALDRILATRLGAFAVEQALAGIGGVMVGLHANSCIATPLAQTWERTKELDENLLKLQTMLIR